MVSSIVPIFGGRGFDAEATQNLGKAYDIACRSLHVKGQPPLIQETLAKKIIEAAQRGERDPDRLAAIALGILGPFHCDVTRRFGLIPNFFVSAPDAPEIVEKLWDFAKSGYLDNPIPALFKERTSRLRVGPNLASPLPLCECGAIVSGVAKACAGLRSRCQRRPSTPLLRGDSSSLRTAQAWSGDPKRLRHSAFREGPKLAHRQWGDHYRTAHQSNCDPPLHQRLAGEAP
jgi:hypothetical protein